MIRRTRLTVCFVVATAAVVLASTAAGLPITRGSVVFLHNHVQARVVVSTQAVGSTRSMWLKLSTRRPGGTFRLVATQRLDRWPKGFSIASFRLDPKRDSALIELAWQRRGSTQVQQRSFKATRLALVKLRS